MKCEEFKAWLENRDLHDLSEADRAHKHALECIRCSDVLKNEEALDQFIASSLSADPLPDGLVDRIDLSIDKPLKNRQGKGLFASVAAMCVVVAALFIFNTGQQRFVSMDELGTFALEDHQDHTTVEAVFEQVTDARQWLAANNDQMTYPPVKLTEGYRVKGARFCKLGHCQAVHMVYEKSGELVSVFVIDESEVGFLLDPDRVYTITIGGNNVKMLREKDKVYALVT